MICKQLLYTSNYFIISTVKVLVLSLFYIVILNKCFKCFKKWTDLKAAVKQLVAG